MYRKAVNVQKSNADTQSWRCDVNQSSCKLTDVITQCIVRRSALGARPPTLGPVSAPSFTARGPCRLPQSFRHSGAPLLRAVWRGSRRALQLPAALQRQSTMEEIVNNIPNNRNIPDIFLISNTLLVAIAPIVTDNNTHQLERSCQTRSFSLTFANMSDHADILNQFCELTGTNANTVCGRSTTASAFEILQNWNSDT